MSTAAATGEPATNTRPTLRSVAMPTEHGGWGLTSEPGVLGLLLVPSFAGLCLALAAMVAFLVRTPAKLAVVDLRRGRRLDRTNLAIVVALAEAVVMLALVVAAVLLATDPFWVPLLVAAPLIALEASFEVRSRGRRLVPELAGAIGVCSVAAMVVLAGGGSATLAAGAWIVLSARIATSIPHVRTQVAQIHDRATPASQLAAADLVALVVAAVAVVVDFSLLAGSIAVVAVIGLQRLGERRPVPRPAVIGIRQMFMGYGVVAFTALGAHLL